MQRKPTNRQHLGRPRLPEAERKNCTVRVRLTTAERVAVEDAADAAGVTLAAFVLEAVRRQLTRK